MQRFLSTSLLLLVLTSFSLAQELGYHGVAAQVGLVVPTSSGYTAGVALGAKVNMGEIYDGVTLMPFIQYHLPGFDEPTGSVGDLTVSTLVIGVDGHYPIDEKTYVGAGLNYNIVTVEWEVDFGPFFGGRQTIDASGSEIGLSVLGGYNFDLAGYNSAVEGRYNLVSGYNSLVVMLNVFFGE